MGSKFCTDSWRECNSLLGSMNLDYRSIGYNCELLAGIRSPEFTQQMERGFALTQINGPVLNGFALLSRSARWLGWASIGSLRPRSQSTLVPCGTGRRRAKKAEPRSA